MKPEQLRRIARKVSNTAPSPRIPAKGAAVREFVRQQGPPLNKLGKVRAGAKRLKTSVKPIKEELLERAYEFLDEGPKINLISPSTIHRSNMHYVRTLGGTNRAEYNQRIKDIAIRLRQGKKIEI